MITVDSYPTSGRPFYSGGDVIAQFLRSLQCPLDPDNFHLAGRNLLYGLRNWTTTILVTDKTP